MSLHHHGGIHHHQHHQHQLPPPPPQHQRQPQHYFLDGPSGRLTTSAEDATLQVFPASEAVVGRLGQHLSQQQPPHRPRHLEDGEVDEDAELDDEAADDEDGGGGPIVARTIVASGDEVSNGFVKDGKRLPYVFEANESGEGHYYNSILSF